MVTALERSAAQTGAAEGLTHVLGCTNPRTYHNLKPILHQC